jgi:hypothetical protein
MQKLEKRRSIGNDANDTPRNTPHVPGLCGRPLKVVRGSDGAVDSTTFSNNPEVATTATEQAGRNKKVTVVYVQNRFGQPLMPCSPCKAKHLLDAGKARVVKRTPFTIRLTIEVGHAMQPIKLGVDSGERHIGLSATTEKKEVFSAQVELRTDMVKLNSERRMYRRNRRNRKTWYRPARFFNRSKSKGWLAPSIQHKFDGHVKYVEFVKKLLPVTEVRVEVANFDIQKIKNPDIKGEGYQQGPQSGFWNVREYVFHRDGHLCQSCKGKSKDKILNVHHLTSRQTGGDRPANLITLCKTCHEEHHAGKIELKVKKVNGFRAETFMSTIRWLFVNNLRKKGYNVSHTFGYITKSGRIALGLPKAHINDAFIIAEGANHSRCQSYIIKQVRKNNRKLFKGDRSHLKNTAPRFVKGFQRYDKVLYNGIECFIFGRRIRGYFNLQRLDGTKINSDANCKTLKLLESASTSLIELSNRDSQFPSGIEAGVPLGG